MSLYNGEASVVCLSFCKLLRKSLLLTDKWPDRHQTFTRWTPGQHASRVCSRSRSRSKVTWYAHFLGFLEWATPSLTVWSVFVGRGLFVTTFTKGSFLMNNVSFVLIIRMNYENYISELTSNVSLFIDRTGQFCHYALLILLVCNGFVKWSNTSFPGDTHIRPLSWLADNFTASLAPIAAYFSASRNFCGRLWLSIFAA